MDVRCERCSTEYEFDDALVSDKGTTVKCMSCGHQFRVARPSALKAPDKWLVRRPDGQELMFVSLRELQKAIAGHQVGKEDHQFRGALRARSLGSIPELQPFFERATRSPKTTARGLGMPTPAPPGAVRPPVPSAPPAGAPALPSLTLTQPFVLNAGGSTRPLVATARTHTPARLPPTSTSSRPPAPAKSTPPPPLLKSTPPPVAHRPPPPVANRAPLPPAVAEELPPPEAAGWLQDNGDNGLDSDDAPPDHAPSRSSAAPPARVVEASAAGSTTERRTVRTRSVPLDEDDDLPPQRETGLTGWIVAGGVLGLTALFAGTLGRKYLTTLTAPEVPVGERHAELADGDFPSRRPRAALGRREGVERGGSGGREGHPGAGERAGAGGRQGPRRPRAHRSGKGGRGVASASSAAHLGFGRAAGRDRGARRRREARESSRRRRPRGRAREHRSPPREARRVEALGRLGRRAGADGARAGLRPQPD